MLGPGLVLHVENNSAQPLFAIVTLNNPTTHAEKSFRLDVPSNGSAEIGHKEGWILATGDKVKVSNDAYKTFEGSVP